jgi:hypothetical protein
MNFIVSLLWSQQTLAAAPNRAAIHANWGSLDVNLVVKIRGGLPDPIDNARETKKAHISRQLGSWQSFRYPAPHFAA